MVAGSWTVSLDHLPSARPTSGFGAASHELQEPNCSSYGIINVFCNVSLLLLVLSPASAWGAQMHFFGDA